MKPHLIFLAQVSPHRISNWHVVVCIIVSIILLATFLWPGVALPTRASAGGGYAIQNQNHIEIPHSVTLEPPAITIEAWVNQNTHLGSNQYIVFKNNSRSPHSIEGYCIYVGGPEDRPQLAGTVSSAEGIQVSVASLNPINPGEWYHVVFQADAEQISLYVNGEFQVSNQTGFPLDYSSNPTYPTYIAWNGIEGPYRFTGAIDEVRIWNTKLSQTTIQQWMHREVSSAHPNYANLAGYWKLNEGSGEIAYDSSPNGNHSAVMLNQIWFETTAPLNNLTAHQNDITAMWKGRPSTTTDVFAAGLDISNVDFLNDVGDDIVFGHNNASFASLTTHLPAGVDKRWARVWELAVTNVWPMSSDVDLTFDISDYGGQGDFSPSGSYFLLKRPAGSSEDFSIVPVSSTNISGDQLTFRVDVSNLGSEFTLGATEGSPTAVYLQEFDARQEEGNFKDFLLVIILGLSLLSLFMAWRSQHSGKDAHK